MRSAMFCRQTVIEVSSHYLYFHTMWQLTRYLVSHTADITRFIPNNNMILVFVVELMSEVLVYYSTSSSMHEHYIPQLRSPKGKVAATHNQLTSRRPSVTSISGHRRALGAIFSTYSVCCRSYKRPMRNRLHGFVANVLLYVYINLLHETPSSHGGVLLFVPDRTDLERLLVSVESD